MSSEQTSVISLDQRIARALANTAEARAALAPFRTRKALAGIKTIELSLTSLRRRLEAGEDCEAQVAAIALLVGKLADTMRGAFAEPWVHDEHGDRRCRTCGYLWYVGWSSCPLCSKVTR